MERILKKKKVSIDTEDKKKSSCNTSKKKKPSVDTENLDKDEKKNKKKKQEKAWNGIKQFKNFNY